MSSNDKIKPVYTREGSENSKKSSGKKPSSFAVRHPLRDICDNVPEKRVLSSRKVEKSRTFVEVKHVKETALNEKQTKVTYFKKSEKVTEREKNEEVVRTLDEVFVEGEDHYVNYLPKNNFLDVCAATSGRAKSEDSGGEVNKPLPVFRISGPGSSNLAEIKKPAQKVTLARKLSKRHSPRNEDLFYEDELYDEEYFEDNYLYMLRAEKKYILRKDRMLKCIHEDYRRINVNWLCHVQQIVGCTDATFLKAIRIYDFVLLTKPPCKLYILAGITCLWITCKDMDVPYIQVPKLYALCNGRYGKHEFLAMETEILKLLKFDLNFPEPSSFLFYYLHQENLHKNSKIRNSAMFLLELFTLLLDFSSLPPSLLACIALYVVLVRNGLHSYSFLKFVNSNVLDEETFIQKCKEMEYCVDKLLECKSASKEIVEKYSGEKKSSVALDFLSP